MLDNEITTLLNLIESQAQELKKLNASLDHRVEQQLQQHEMRLLQAFDKQSNRNFLANDDSVAQKTLICQWGVGKGEEIGYQDFLNSGFRVYSQNDEDGILLRIFTQIGMTNRYVAEIGSNCSCSALSVPENMSTNLLVNHGWHGSIFEIDHVECTRMIHFFANHLSTKHFHYESKGVNGYYSPQVVCEKINSSNVNDIFRNAIVPDEPDLLVVDIDGDDYVVVENIDCISPRVIVVEFEKRFRHRFSVVQRRQEDFNTGWVQSGTVSLLAWERLLGEKGYYLCSVSSVGFNAFFVRKDVAQGKIRRVMSEEVFDFHPIFSNLKENFWLEPDDTWSCV